MVKIYPFSDQTGSNLHSRNKLGRGRGVKMWEKNGGLGIGRRERALSSFPPSVLALPRLNGSKTILLRVEHRSRLFRAVSHFPIFSLPSPIQNKYEERRAPFSLPPYFLAPPTPFPFSWFKNHTLKGGTGR